MPHFRPGHILLAAGNLGSSSPEPWRLIHMAGDGSLIDIHEYTPPASGPNFDPAFMDIEQIADKLYFSWKQRVVVYDLNDNFLNTLITMPDSFTEGEEVGHLVVDNTNNGDILVGHENIFTGDEDILRIDRLTGARLATLAAGSNDSVNNRYAILYSEPCRLYFNALSSVRVEIWDICNDALITNNFYFESLSDATYSISGYAIDQIDGLLYIGLSRTAAVDPSPTGLLYQFDIATGTKLQTWAPLYHGSGGPWSPIEIELSLDRQTVWMKSAGSTGAGKPGYLFSGLDVNTGNETIINLLDYLDDGSTYFDGTALHVIRPAGGVPFSQVIGAS